MDHIYEFIYYAIYKMGIIENITQVESIILILITIALLILKIIISYYISQSVFYAQLRSKEILRPEIAVITTVLVYGFAILGIFYLFSDNRNESMISSLFVTALFILLLIVSLIWQVFFGFFHNIQLSALGYLLFIVVLCYYIYEVAKVSLFAALMTLPLLVREIVYFLFVEQLFVDNPGKVV